jgi:hypothetical protein
MEWLNKGVAPAYNAYELRGRLIPISKGGKSIDFLIEDSGNKNWMPGELSIAKYNTKLPNRPNGEYWLAIQIFDSKSNRPVDLGMMEEFKQDNYFLIQKITF